ncbi:cytochrome d ubiquinol oxidase subunit II [Nocardiopsis suaedae]|uniref:Cytochrome d ubiquinol oxidase subunit II n=1 Tax=Nocardiopsis suaedae TaxID=3018444 RepID=A0ABT4TNJ1_9ACTN|nr:cytochrome d ubiquinol oxidase subunit II [Nocardiopsis suaedae]MDA2806206.1 cytochrome d ubiquinol oxidase subunit II [Nocardiopsis suaedae]
MTMQTAWLLLLGGLLAGYFVLGGYDYGAQALRPLLARDGGRRATMAALGPFFFGNEVWLVAFAGVLFGAFPFLEGPLLAGLYPVLVPLLLALVAGKAAVQLRGRARTRAAERVWDALITAGGLVPALLWGTVTGVLLNGVAFTGGHSIAVGAALASPTALLCTAASGLLFTAHGAAYLALRTRGGTAGRSAVLLGRLAPTAAGAAVAAVASALAVGGAPGNPAVAAVLGAAIAAALLGAQTASRRGRAGAAFACTSTAAAVFAALPWAAHHPYVLADAGGGGMEIGAAAADGATLAVLSAFGVAVVPLMLAYQAAGWWAFRGRVDDRTPSYL